MLELAGAEAAKASTWAAMRSRAADFIEHVEKAQEEARQKVVAAKLAEIELLGDSKKRRDSSAASSTAHLRN